MNTKTGARTDLTSAQNVLKFNTAEEIGKEYGVHANTVRNDAEFSKSVDKVAEEVGEEAKRYILPEDIINTTTINFLQA